MITGIFVGGLVVGFLTGWLGVTLLTLASINNRKKKGKIKTMKNLTITMILAIVLAFSVAGIGFTAPPPLIDRPLAGKAQVACPVQGGKINKISMSITRVSGFTSAVRNASPSLRRTRRPT